MFSENQQIGLYRLVKQIGRGGFGEVWLAERRTELLTTMVALKLPHGGQVNLEAIRQEAVLWAKASGHPNVLPIIEANIYDRQVVIVSEYAPDGSLEDKLQRNEDFPLSQAVETAIGILNGLDFLHARQIIHRDIKPANILLQGDTPRLADFGISRVINTTALSTAIVGTPKYMAPEAFDGKRSAQTDIWSVGILLYQMLCGNVPFRQENPTEIMWAIVTKEPEPLADSIPPDLRRIVQKALAKLPENRFQSAREMREELQKALLNISHPTFAKTEVFKNPHQFIKPDARTIEDQSTATKNPFNEFAPPVATPPARHFTDKNAPPLNVAGNLNLVPRTVASISPDSEVTHLSSIPVIPAATNKGTARRITRWVFYFLAPVFGAFTLIIADGIAGSLNNELRLFGSLISFLIEIPLTFIPFGIFGLLLGYVFPQEKWKWGLWLNIINFIRMVSLFISEIVKNSYNDGVYKGIRFADPDVGNFVEILLFASMTVFSCMASYLGYRLALRKTDNIDSSLISKPEMTPLSAVPDTTPSTNKGTARRITRWVFCFLAPVIGLLAYITISEITNFLLIGISSSIWRLETYLLLDFLAVTFLAFIVFGIIGALLGYVFPQEKWRWGIWLNIFNLIWMVRLYKIRGEGGFYSVEDGLVLFIIAQIIQFSTMFIVSALTSYLGFRLALRKPEKEVSFSHSF